MATILRTRPEVARHRAEREERELAESGLAIIDEAVIYVTAKGFARYQTEYRRIVNDEIPKTQADKQLAASFGDLSENAEYTAAIEKLGMLSRRVEEMEGTLEKARVIDENSVLDETVAVGCRTTVKNTDSGDTKTYTLLGPLDVDMEKGIISYLSPLGRAFLGKVVGDQAMVTLPNGSLTFTIEKIEVAREALAAAEAGSSNQAG
ncbi:MAG: GreA/GreB family elongation factor [Salinibacterium sp.]|nr:GreA/GreB family elongation factor [Salinibacterium sp.]